MEKINRKNKGIIKVTDTVKYKKYQIGKLEEYGRYQEWKRFMDMYIEEKKEEEQEKRNKYQIKREKLITKGEK